jgi:hypothetical protein
MSEEIRDFFAQHQPSRDRLTCSCGWEAIEAMWVDHLAWEMQMWKRSQ